MPIFTAVNVGINPVPPDEFNPILWLELVQLYVVPAIVFKARFRLTVFPLQYTCGKGVLTCGVGFTVIVNVIGVPVQVVPPFSNFGVTVIVCTIGVVPVFTAVNAGIGPEPEAAKPIVGIELAQS